MTAGVAGAPSRGAQPKASSLDPVDSNGRSLRPAAVAKRNAIIDAARRLFLADGYAATSMDGVTAEAGVSKQTVYAYFGSKQDLLTEVLVVEADKVGVPTTVGSAQDVADLRRKLIALGENLVSALWRPDSIAVMRLVLGEAFRLPELRGMVSETLPKRLIGVSAGLMADADRRGLIDAPWPELSARMFVGAMMSFVVVDGLLQVELSAPPGPTQVEYVVDSVLAAVAVPR